MFTMEPLHRRPDLTDACINLLNSQWPRSKAARLYSLEKSCDDLPYSLVMVQDDDASCHLPVVVGYCRLVKVYGMPKSVLIESVVVPKHLRGRGMGRRLMELAESHAKNKGFTTMYLTTKDKQDFYEHLGYEFCERLDTLDAQLIETCYCHSEKEETTEACIPNCCKPVQKTCSSLPTEVVTNDTSCQVSTINSAPAVQVVDNTPDCNISSLDLSTVPPPPPPPPPPPVRIGPLTNIYWMKKDNL